MSKKMTGKEIREHRIARGLTQAQFSKLLGFSGYGWLSAIENGRVKISKTTEIIFKMEKSKWEKDQ